MFLQLSDITIFKFYSFQFPEQALKTSSFKNLGLTYSNIFFNLKKLKVELEILYSDTNNYDLNYIYDLVKYLNLMTVFVKLKTVFCLKRTNVLF